MNLWLGWAFVIGAIPLAAVSNQSAWLLVILAKLCFMHDDMQKANEAEKDAAHPQQPRATK